MEHNVNIEEIVAQFNNNVRSLINRLERKSRSDIEVANLDRLKKRISLLRRTLGDDALIIESSPFFMEYAEKILEENVAEREKFFLDIDIRAEYSARKGKIEKNDEFMFDLTDSIRSHYLKAHNKEREEVYCQVKTMLSCVLKLQLVNN